jgi:hypothetical protein
MQHDSMKTAYQLGKDAFHEWARIGALLHRAGNYAVVDRGALYPGEQWSITLDRFQVIDFYQERAEPYGLLDVAVRRADTLFGEELFALQIRVIENSRWVEEDQPPRITDEYATMSA